MPIVTVHDLKEQLAFTCDIGGADDVLLERKLAAAQNHVERLLGFRIADRFGGEDQEPVPPALAEAVLQLATWWYENREAVNVGNIVTQVPFSVNEIVTEYREFSF